MAKTMTAKENQQNMKTEEIFEIPLNQIQPSQDLIRDMDGAILNDLRESIKVYGVLQPILVRPIPEKFNQFEIICGNHRFYAAKGACLKTIPARIKKVGKYDALLIAITENVQRLSMNPIREGELYSKLPWDCKVLSEKLGKSVTYIRGRISLYKNLVPKLQDKVGEKLTLSSAVALSKIPRNKQIEVFEEIERTKNTIENEAMPKNPSYGTYGDSGWSRFCICPKCGSKHEKGVSYEKNNAEMP